MNKYLEWAKSVMSGTMHEPSDFNNLIGLVKYADDPGDAVRWSKVIGDYEETLK